MRKVRGRNQCDGVREKRTYSLYWQVSGENNFLTPRFFELGTLDRDCPFSVYMSKKQDSIDLHEKIHNIKISKGMNAIQLSVHIKSIAIV